MRSDRSLVCIYLDFFKGGLDLSSGSEAEEGAEALTLSLTLLFYRPLPLVPPCALSLFDIVQGSVHPLSSPP